MDGYRCRRRFRSYRVHLDGPQAFSAAGARATTGTMRVEGVDRDILPRLGTGVRDHHGALERKGVLLRRVVQVGERTYASERGVTDQAGAVRGSQVDEDGGPADGPFGWRARLGMNCTIVHALMLNALPRSNWIPWEAEYGKRRRRR